MTYFSDNITKICHGLLSIALSQLYVYSVGIQYLEAIRRLKAVKYEPNRTIHCLFVPDEEIGSERGMKKLVHFDEFKALNIGFVLDEGIMKIRIKLNIKIFFLKGLASDNDTFQVHYGTRSVMWVEFTIKGNTGHGSGLIKNTASEKVQFITNEMLSYRTREQQRLKESQTSDKPLQLGDITTINLTKMSGGVQVNIVPDQYVLVFDCRIKPNGHHSFQGFLVDLMRRTPKKNDDEVKISYLADTGPLLLTNIENSSWWLKSFKQTLKDMKCKSNWTIFPAGNDSRFLRNAGYPAIGFSPIINTPILLHDHNEHLSKDVFLNGIEIYVKLIQNLTNQKTLSEEINSN